jgi:hypothetical protein
VVVLEARNPTLLQNYAEGRINYWVAPKRKFRLMDEVKGMEKCLNCGHDVGSEYDSQICLPCAGELPARASQRFSIRSILTTLHVHRARPVVANPASVIPTGTGPRRP